MHHSGEHAVPLEVESASIDPLVQNRYSFQNREVVCVGLGGNLVVFTPPWWSKTSLSFIGFKFLAVGILEQIIAVVPLALYIILFEYIIIQSFIHGIGSILLGLIACMIGLWLFIEGLKNGLIPLSEKLGYLIPTKTTKVFFFFLNPLIFFVVGTGVTVAEPAIIALKAIGQIVSAESKPYLYYLLNEIPVILTFCIGIGCGIAFTIGYFKTQYNLDFKKLIMIILIPTMLMTLGMTFDEDLKSLVALSWDCGAITTGEVTVPVIVGLGSGASTEDPFSSLGLLSMASLMPIATVQMLAIITRFAVDRSRLIIQGIHQFHGHDVLPWYEMSGVKELLETLEITIPLILLFFVLIKFGYKSQIPALGLKHLFHETSEYLKRLRRKSGEESSRLDSINYMPIFLFLSVVGLYLFNIGLHFGLAALGTSVGADTPHLFLNMSKFGPPYPNQLFSFGGGLTILLFFGFFLGYAANLAEPAMEILGTKVQAVTQGEFSKRLFVHSASVGVGVGVVIGLLKIVYNVYLFYLILPIYAFTCFLTYYSSNAMAHIAWDAGAITTGPVTVPLIMGIGVAVAIQVGTFDGFGVLALSSVCPITCVLLINMAIEKIFPKSDKPSPEPEIIHMGDHEPSLTDDDSHATELLSPTRNFSNYGATETSEYH